MIRKPLPNPAMTRRTKLMIGAAALLISGGVAARTFLLPPTHSTPVKATPSVSSAEFDHDHKAFDEILKSHVKSNRVDYAALKANPMKLNAYLGQLAAVEEAEFYKWGEQQQLAMLINLYNAATLKLVIDHYPVKSIKNIGGLFKRPWDIKSLTLFGESTTLGHVEHGLLRKKYSEPRIHFAIVCAAEGCPPLRARAYTAAQLDSQLEEQGRAFLRDSGKNRVDAANRTVYLSKIFDWFEEDFEKDGSVIDFVAPYFAPADSKALRSHFKIKYTDYDWSLNKR